MQMVQLNLFRLYDLGQDIGIGNNHSFHLLRVFNLLQ